MAWNTVRKEDKTYSFDKEGLTLVEYTNDGRLYFVDNLNNILVGEDDFLAVSYIPSSDTDNRLPVVCVRGLGSIGKDFLKVCRWLNFDPKDTDELPRYHEENIIKNISREDGGNGENGDGGGMSVVSVNPATGEEMTTNSNSKPFNRPNNQNGNQNGNSNNPNHNNDSNGEGVNTSEASHYDEYAEFLEELEKQSEKKPEEQSVQLEEKISSIFSFVRRVH